MTEEECKNKIETLDWSGLDSLWNQIKDCKTPDWDNGKAFEYLVIRMFQLDLYKVKYPFSVKMPFNNKSMEQIDGVIYHDTLGVLIESKDYSKDGVKRNISIEPIAKLRNQLSRRPYLTMGCVFSAGGYTESVSTLIDYLGNETILLWEGEEVEYCIKNKKIRAYFEKKLENRIELGIHNFNVTTLDFAV
jgi:hypothetical protein